VALAAPEPMARGIEFSVVGPDLRRSDDRHIRHGARHRLLAERLDRLQLAELLPIIRTVEASCC
jgi:hypothetical protein